MFAIIPALIRLLGVFAQWAHDRMLFRAGVDQAKKEDLEIQAKRVEQANQTRARVRTTVSGGGLYIDPYDSDNGGH
jgi:hypothetical protein